MLNKLYSTQNISSHLLSEIADSLKNIKYGSIELYVVDGEVVQITRKSIKKTNGKNRN